LDRVPVRAEPGGDMRTDDRLLAGRYRLQGTLGVGMATVFRAHDELLNRQVAIKVLADVTDDRARARFMHEAQAGGQLASPHVVTVYDVAEDGEMAYIVMEYVAGRSLAQVLEGGQPMEAAEAVNIAVAVLQGLAVAHRRSLIHRDIKPGNILLSDDGDVKLVDFGIAKGLSRASVRITGEHRIVGTPRYLSPEQVSDQLVTARSDLYSLGVVLYEMLAGSPPFDNDNPMALVLAHAESPVPPLGRKRPDLPVALMVAVHRALEKDPRRRFEDATAMRHSLCESLEGDPVVIARPAPKPRPGLKARSVSKARSVPKPGPAPPAAAAEAAASPGPPRRWPRRVAASLLAVAGLALLVTAGPLLFEAITGAPAADPASPQGVRETPGESGSPAAAAPAPAPAPVVSPAPAPAEQGLDGAALSDRIEALGEQDGTERTVEAARLVGDMEVAADEGRVARAFSEPSIAALLDEAGIPGLIALVEADPQAAGPAADAIISAVAQVDELDGLQRAVAAAEVVNSAKIAERDGEVTRTYAGAVIEVMAAEAGTAGLAELLERSGGPEGDAVAEDLRGLDSLGTTAAKVEVASTYNEVEAGPLPGDLRYTARKVLEPLLTFRGLAGLAASYDLLTGPSGRDRLLEVRSSRGQDRATAAAAVLGAAQVGASVGTVPSSYASTVRIALRSRLTLEGVAALAAASGDVGAGLADDLSALDGLAPDDRSAQIVAVYGRVSTARLTPEAAAEVGAVEAAAVQAAASERLRQELSVNGLGARVTVRPGLAGPDGELSAERLAALQAPEDAARSAQAARLYGDARQLTGDEGQAGVFATSVVAVLPQYLDVAGLVELSTDEAAAGGGAADFGQRLRDLAAAPDDQRAQLAAALLVELRAALDADVTAQYAAAVREVLNNSPP